LRVKQERGVLLDEADVSGVFSYRQTRFEVSSARYGQLIEFLHSIMPGKFIHTLQYALGLHFLAKATLRDDLMATIRKGERFTELFGVDEESAGHVTITMALPSSGVVLKVIRAVGSNGILYKVTDMKGMQSGAVGDLLD